MMERRSAPASIFQAIYFPNFLSEKERPDFVVIGDQIVSCLQLLLAQTAGHMAYISITRLSESMLCAFHFT